MSHKQELAEVINPLISQVNGLMRPLGEANIRPTDDIIERIIAFKMAISHASAFVMYDIHDQEECDLIKGLVTESAQDLKLGLEIQHALHLNRN